MKYEIIQPPFALKFRTMSRQEANDHFNWFIEQIPIRIKILEKAIQSTPGYEDWKADETPESLDAVGQWFYEHVETRKSSKQEIEAIYNNAPAWFREVELEDWELTNRTFSLAIDIGMYFSQVMERNQPGLKWVMVKKPKNDANFQQPVLSGAGKLVLNPIRILDTFAYGIARRSKESDRLRELYDIWANILTK